MALDANWRWTHNVGGYSNCYSGTSWDSSYCPTPAACAENCAIDGVDQNDLRGTYGVTSDGDTIKLDFVT